MPDVVLQGLRPISKMDRPFCLLEFFLGETLMLGFLMDFCQFFASHLGNQSTTKEKSTQETLAFRVGFLWSGWSEGWTMATCFSCHESKKSPSRRCNGFISKKHLGNNDQFCWWGTLMPSVWTLTSIITTAITSITITFLRFVLVARTSNSEPRWAAGCYSWSWKHLKPR